MNSGDKEYSNLAYVREPWMASWVHIGEVKKSILNPIGVTDVLLRNDMIKVLLQGNYYGGWGVGWGGVKGTGEGDSRASQSLP